MTVKVFEYDVSWFSDNQRCMVHAEFKATDMFSLIKKIAPFFTENELKNMHEIKRIRRVLKRDLTPLAKDEFYPVTP